MGQVRFSGKPHLAFVNPGRINIGALNDIQVGIWKVIADLIDYIVNPDQCRSSLLNINYLLLAIDFLHLFSGVSHLVSSNQLSKL